MGHPVYLFDQFDDTDVSQTMYRFGIHIHVSNFTYNKLNDHARPKPKTVNRPSGICVVIIYVSHHHCCVAVVHNRISQGFSFIRCRPIHLGLAERKALGVHSGCNYPEAENSQISPKHSAT